MNMRDNNKGFENNIIEVFIKLAILATMVVSTLFIVKPFIVPVIWGIIIAVTAEPLIGKVADLMGGRRKLASGLFALVVVAALVIPLVMLTSSSLDALQSISKELEANALSVPPPPVGVKDWPIIGPSLSKIWTQASTNLAVALKQHGPQLEAAAQSLLGSIGGGVVTVFMFIISVFIAAALLATAEKGTKTINRIVSRFVGERGGEITTLATATIRGVMQGVVGVAIIQSILSTIGMVLVGVPAAGLWAILVLIVTVIQIPAIIILGPVAAWVFTATDTIPAVIFLVWAILVSASDGVLKPLLMGRGVDIPMLVILIGALGGMVLFGIVGLFVGAVIVAISYTLFTAWVDEQQLTDAEVSVDKE